VISKELRKEINFWQEENLPKSWYAGSFFEITDDMDEACLVFVQRNRKFPNGVSYLMSAYALLKEGTVTDVIGSKALLPEKGSRVIRRGGFIFLKKIPEDEGREILGKLTWRSEKNEKKIEKIKDTSRREFIAKYPEVAHLV